MKILSQSIEKQNKLIKSKKLNQTNLLFPKKIPLNSHQEDSLPNGFKTIINFGNRVKTEISANNIAKPVNIPK